MSPRSATAPALGRRFLRLAVFNILSNISVPLAGLIDTAMLGQLDDIAYLSGVSLGAVLFSYVYWTFGFLRMGATGETAQAAGRRDAPEEYHVLYRSVAIALAIAAAILILQGPIRAMGFGLMAGAPAVKAAGEAYFNARIWAAPATLTGFVFLGWFLGREQSGRVLWITLVSNLANVGLNYVFILELGWASYGAGLATALSQYLALAVALALFWQTRRSLRRASPEVHAASRPQRSLLLNAERLRRLFGLNRDIMIRTFALVSSFALFTNFSAELGVAILAANTILLRFLELAAYLIDGAAFADESLAGVFKGEQNLQGLKRLIRLSLWSGFAFAALFFAPLLLAPKTIFGWMTVHEAVIALLLRYDIMLIPALIFGAAAFIFDGVFIGLTEGKALRNTMLISFAAFLAPALYGLHVEENVWLWIAMVAFMAARAIGLGIALQMLLKTYAAQWKPIR